MSGNGHDRRASDPLTILTQGMRRMSSLRFEDLTRGFENFANPSARGMLESMGRTREEQVATMAGMLRNSSEADIEEMGQVFALAMAKLAEERSNAEPVGRSGRRKMTAKEWREQRRLVP